MERKGFLYIVLASILWGTSGIFVKYLAPYGIEALQMTLIRALVAFVCMALYVVLKRTEFGKTSIGEMLLFAGSGLAFFGTATCYFQSMQLTSVSTAVVLMYTAPVFVMIYSVAFLGEKLTKTKLASLVTMIVGCGFVSGIIGGLKFNFLGIAMGFLSGISYAAYNIFTKIQMNKGIEPAKSNLYSFLFAVVAGLLLSHPSGIVHAISHAPLNVTLLGLGMGIFTCVLPYFLYSSALCHVPAGTASSLGIIEPMAATIFSVLIFGERLSFTCVLGILLILGAVFILSREKQ